MRRPRMSTGAWIFTGLVSAAVIAPAGVYAAAAAKTQIVGSATSHIAGVTTQGQLLTTQISPTKVVHASTVVPGPCKPVYIPPAGKAIVVVSVVYNYGSGVQGNENFGGLFSAGCSNIYDQIDQIDKYGSLQHNYPTGLPMPNVYADSSGGSISVFLTGYLIDATSLPSAANGHTSGTVKSLPARR